MLHFCRGNGVSHSLGNFRGEVNILDRVGDSSSPNFAPTLREDGQLADGDDLVVGALLEEVPPALFVFSEVGEEVCEVVEVGGGVPAAFCAFDEEVEELVESGDGSGEGSDGGDG